jgi:AcrR family transcriptional regulator
MVLILGVSMRMQKKKYASRGVEPEPDERVEKSKKAVLAATYELLTESGLGGVSVDEVSRRSGVAKTTIYRHWPSRESLLLDACSQLSSRPPVPDTGNLRSDLETLAAGASVRLRQPWSTVMPSIIDAAERDEDLAELQSQIHSQMRGAFMAVIERAQKRGELPASQDARELVATILGPILYRRYFSREPLSENFAKAIVARALGKLR